MLRAVEAPPENEAVSAAPGVSTHRKTVLVVDDHPLTLRGLVETVNCEEDFQIVGEATSLAEATQELQARQPEMMVLDLNLKDGSGLDLLKDLKARDALPDTLVVSINEENIYAERALKAGARGYLMKEEAAERVVESLRRIERGDIAVSERLSTRIFERLAQPRRQTAKPREEPSEQSLLSDREMAVYELVGRGRSSKEIAQILQISPKTVGTYRARIAGKLGLHGSAELILHAAHWLEQQH